MDSPGGAVRFAPEHPPSVGAALAVLDLATGPWLHDWFQPSVGFLEFLDRVLSFVREVWNDPTVYSDYWSEFSLPLLSDRILGPAVDNNGPLFSQSRVGGLAGIEDRLFGQQGPPIRAEQAWQMVSPQALGETK
jgi:hypothetical protein